ncbi:hypothetical protein RhiirA4_423304 [Rhizophagus irregularis]|uniref:Uncharacterized protein n=1 Tax=Rhizophagus irregularis TaxID=588596 RepID=A0A2I1GTB7_9GLOM|nr:hypothetical protein RhiirA4_423304 [Rhizophagus irregularis]
MSTLTVIGLVAHVKSSERTVHGEAMYREKITGQNHRFLFKQFVNARQEYNEAFREGDLVLFGGKFTIDEKKLMKHTIIFTKSVNFHFCFNLTLMIHEREKYC